MFRPRFPRSRARARIRVSAHAILLQNDRPNVSRGEKILFREYRRLYERS